MPVGTGVESIRDRRPPAVGAGLLPGAPALPVPGPGCRAPARLSADGAVDQVMVIVPVMPESLWPVTMQIMS